MFIVRQFFAGFFTLVATYRLEIGWNFMLMYV